MGTEPVFVEELAATERILESESPGHNCGSNIDLSRCNELGDDIIQVDDQTNREAKVQPHMISQGSSHKSQSSNPLEVQNTMLNSQAGGSIRTADLLASEVAGSWACITAPSVHQGNNYLNSEDDNDGAAALHDFMAMVFDSQNVLPSMTIGTRWNRARQALSEMISIVAPDMEEQFSCAVGSNYNKYGAENKDASHFNTEGCYENDHLESNTDVNQRRKLMTVVQ